MKVVCQVCGREFNQLNNSHLKTHGIQSSGEYRLKFPGCKLVSDEYSLVRSKITTQMIKDNPQVLKFGLLNTLTYSKSDIGRKRSGEAIRKWSIDNPDKFHANSCRSKPYLIERNKTDKMRKYIGIYNRNKPQGAITRAAASLRRRYAEGTLTPAYTKGKRFLYNETLFKYNWEIYLVKWLEEHNIFWEYEEHIFQYESGEGKLRIYYPDFYLPDLDIFVEVKWSKKVDDEILRKISSVINAGWEIYLMTELNWDIILEKINKFHIERVPRLCVH